MERSRTIADFRSTDAGTELGGRQRAADEFVSTRGAHGSATRGSRRIPATYSWVTLTPETMRPVFNLALTFRIALSAAVLPLAPSLGTAQTATDSAAIRQAALDYLEGFYEGDTTRLVRSIRPEVYKYGFFVPRGATKYEGEQMMWPEFHSYANGVKKSGRTAPATAPKKIQLLDVLDQTAAVKVTAFWGTDYLLLGRYDGRWMISHVLWQSPPQK